MNKILIILTVISCFPFIGSAQSNESLTLSLKEAIEKGIQNRFDIKADQYNIRLAKNKIQQNKKTWIPDLHAEGSAQYNTDLEPTVVPEGFAGFTEPSLLSLGSKSTTALGLSLEQPIFKPGINADIKIAKANRDFQQEKIRGNTIEIKNKIAQTYLNVLLKKLQYKIAQKEEKRFKKYKILVEGKYKNGVLIKNNYLRAKLDYENAQVKTKRLHQNYALALEYLKYQINVPQATEIVLSDRIDQIPLEKNLQPQEYEEGNRTEIKQLQLQQKENKLQLKRVRQNALPSLSIVGYYAQLYQNENFHLNESKWWAPHSYIGLKLSIPITENFRNKNKIYDRQLKQNQLLLDLKQKKSDVHYQIQKTTTDRQNTFQNMQSAKDNYDLSQVIYKNQEQQLSIGEFEYNDLLETEKSLHLAEQNYIKTTYEFLSAEIAYQKALGKL